ncbi:MAG: flavin monoamine oxidase family protein [Anaerolineae bacterium]
MLPQLPSKAQISLAAHNGLPPTAAPHREVIIVGAGMAGLTAAYELQRAGYKVTILEARQRVGGRIETLREPFSNGLYAEAGAMRIPRQHDLTRAYCERFGLTLNPFTTGNPQAYYFFAGNKMRISEATARPNLLPFNLAPHEQGRTIQQLWRAAIADLEQAWCARDDSVWSDVMRRFDHLSIRQFLEHKGWSEGAIEMYGLIAQQEALMNSSFLEVLHEELCGYYEEMDEIAGGMDRLPNAFLPELAPVIRFGARIFAIDQDPDSVTVHYLTPAGRFSVRGDASIITLPLPVLRHIEMLRPFLPAKQLAIRQLHYEEAAKIQLQFRRRFWEEDEGIYGGTTLSDLPIRATYYPEHGRETGRGVLLASYTWSEDAQRWGSLSPSERIAHALENVARIHPQAGTEFEVGTSKVWHDDDCAGGAFALFNPGQQARLHEAIIAPEERIILAGEHTCLTHAWIQGAIESGLRAALWVHGMQDV